MATLFAANEAASLAKGRWAQTARLEAAAERFGVSLTLVRSRAAEATRLTAMAKHFTAMEAANLQRARAAEIARLNAMAAYFAAVSGK